MQKNVKSTANCRQEPHPEDWLRQAYRRDPRFRKGRSQDTWRDVTRTQEKDSDKDQDELKLQDERRYGCHGRHESCGQHGRQEP